MRVEPILQEITVAKLVTFWRPGSYDWSWAEEYADVMQHEQTPHIAQRIADEGFGFIDHISPILLGNDGRVWDGHHRICLAIQQGVPTLKVEVVGGNNE